MRRAHALSKASETEIRPTGRPTTRSTEAATNAVTAAAAAGVFLLYSAWYASLPPPLPPSCLLPPEFQNLKRFHFASTSTHDNAAAAAAAAREVQGPRSVRRARGSAGRGAVIKRARVRSQAPFDSEIVDDAKLEPRPHNSEYFLSVSEERSVTRKGRLSPVCLPACQLQGSARERGPSFRACFVGRRDISRKSSSTITIFSFPDFEFTRF